MAYYSSEDHQNINQVPHYSELIRLRMHPEPKTYKFLPSTFLIKVRNPENFIPYSHQKYFNEKIFYNVYHRECFNSCVDTSSPEQCYSNCQSKHSTSVELFKTAVEEKRKYSPITSYLNLKEYQKRPDEMGKNVISDADYNKKFLDMNRKFREKYSFDANSLETGFMDFFNKTYNTRKITTNIFDIYVKGQYPPYAKEADKRNDVSNRYSEYTQLNEKYGSQINSVLEKEFKEDTTWGHINGDDYEGI